GLPNRLLIEERLRGELARAERYKTAVSVMLLDLDNFRTINRTCGHAAGDRMLKVIAGMIRSSIREADFIGRYGGEEFVVIFPETQARDAMHIAEKLRVAIAGSNFRYGERQISITASSGLTQCRAGDSVDVLLERADGVLYEAKAAGRDRCVSDADMDAAQPK
ncbi:MAG: GGDEF domain-containing protein, partial [Pseudomonadota bacterium]